MSARTPTSLRRSGTVFTDENYGIAVCKSKTDLLAKINTGLAAVKADGLIDELTEKWLAATSNQPDLHAA